MKQRLARYWDMLKDLLFGTATCPHLSRDENGNCTLGCKEGKDER